MDAPRRKGEAGRQTGSRRTPGENRRSLSFARRFVFAFFFIFVLILLLALAAGAASHAPTYRNVVEAVLDPRRAYALRTELELFCG